MELLQMFWLLWLDGWTGEHWSTIAWTASTTGGFVLGIILYFIRRADMKRYGL